ncbi:hypothetical protein MOC03_18500, partial [Bacillus atrophaeus]|nr:hypothetical protein [Bacillus atrophaeus]
LKILQKREGFLLSERNIFCKIFKVIFIHFYLYTHRGGGHVKNARYLISNGYGTTKVPLRFGAKPETHIVTLAAPPDPSV